MSVASVIASGEFRVGDVLGRAWRLFTGNILFFLAVPFIIYVITFVAAIVFVLLFGVVGWATSSVALITVGIFLAALLVLSLNIVGQGLLLLGAFQRLRGQPLQVGEALQRVMERFVPLCGLGLLWGLGLIATTFVSFFIVSGLAAAAGAWILLLSPAFVVPSTILLIMWAVVVPACVVEGLGPIGSMSRSAGLTKGYRWKIFGIMVLLGLLILAGPALRLILIPISQGLGTLVSTIWFVLWSGYWNASLIMVYHDLRVAQEGIDTGQIAAIFD